MKKKYRYNTQYIWKHPTMYVKKDDKRYDEYTEFKKLHGFSPDECWNLDSVLVKFLLPRLRYLRVHTIGYPPKVEAFEKWMEVLDSIIFSFEEYLVDEYIPSLATLKRTGLTKQQYNEKFSKGLELFGQYWHDFWW